MTNAAICGYGYAGRTFHAYLIERAQGLNLTAVATRDAERQRAAAHDYPACTVYGTLDELLADETVDLVVLATPHNTHRDLAIRAMNASKHVVVDKIMCMNAQEAQEMIDVSERNSVLLSVFHNRRWDGDYLTVKKVIEDGWLGTPYLYEAGILSYRAPCGWRGVKAMSGGILYDWPAHFVDQALQLVPAKVSTVSCEIVYRDRWQTDIGNYAKLLLRFANGTLFQIEIGNLAALGKPRWYVVGDLGALVKTGLDPQEAALRQGDIDAAVEDPAHRARVRTAVDGELEERIVDTAPGSWQSYYQNIADVLNKGAELAVKPAEMLRLMHVYDAAVKSAETGQVVALGI